MFSLIIVDDEEYMTASLKKYITQYQPDFHVAATFTSAAEALDYLRVSPVDVIITDIRMPHMDGLEMLRHVRALLPDAHILVVSGYSEFAYAKQACSLGVTDYLLKPIDHQELSHDLDTIAKQLSREKSGPSAPKKPPAVQDTDESVIQHAKKYIRAHYADSLSREEVANAVYLDGAYFSRLFKQKTGMSFIEYLTAVRMEKAIELLSTQMSISDIAAAVGYLHRNQFISNFRKYSGFTPQRLPPKNSDRRQQQWSLKNPKKRSAASCVCFLPFCAASCFGRIFCLSAVPCWSSSPPLRSSPTVNPAAF